MRRKITFPISVIGFTFSSWLLLHVLALFGIFLALLYPLWWLFFPKYNFCLLCRVKNEGSWCPLCQHAISHKPGKYTITLRTALLNGGIIAVFTLFSIFGVIGESRVLMFFGFSTAATNASFAIASKGQYLLGEIFPVNIELTNIQHPINAVQTDIAFDPTRVTLLNISMKQSFATVVIQRDIDNKGGYARIAGGIPNPGWQGTQGVFATLYFQAKSPGLATVSYLPSSLILANDGQGTNVLNHFPSLSYIILPKRISSQEISKQRTLLSERVLGASTTSDDLDFSSAVPIISSDNLIPQMQTASPLHITILSTMSNLDGAILSLWQKIPLR